jgi:hypothetical protein
MKLGIKCVDEHFKREYCPPILIGTFLCKIFCLQKFVINNVVMKLGHPLFFGVLAIEARF